MNEVLRIRLGRAPFSSGTTPVECRSATAVRSPTGWRYSLHPSVAAYLPRQPKSLPSSPTARSHTRRENQMLPAQRPQLRPVASKIVCHPTRTVVASLLIAAKDGQQRNARTPVRVDHHFLRRSDEPAACVVLRLLASVYLSSEREAAVASVRGRVRVGRPRRANSGTIQRRPPADLAPILPMARTFFSGSRRIVRFYCTRRILQSCFRTSSSPERRNVVRRHFSRG